MSKKEVARDFLAEDELQKLIEKDFSYQRLNQIRDIFIFSCFTGLANINAKRLKCSHIAFDVEEWIYTKRKKTDSLTKIPMPTTVITIMEQYNEHSQC